MAALFAIGVPPGATSHPSSCTQRNVGGGALQIQDPHANIEWPAGFWISAASMKNCRIASGMTGAKNHSTYPTTRHPVRACSAT